MRAAVQKRKAFVAIVVFGLLFLAFQFWNSGSNMAVDEWDDQGPEIQSLLANRLGEPAGSQDHILYRVKESVASRLALNKCVCEGEKATWNLPFANLLFPRVWAANLTVAVQDEGVKSLRTQEYQRFQKRTWTAADLLVIAEANSPLQYPTQGVVVRPLKTIIVPGLGLKEEPKDLHMVNLTATMGTFDVAATVDAVSITGEGQMHLTLSSPHLPALNRQLQFITYTNTRFHPRTADTVQFETSGHRSVFTIRVGHAATPKLQPVLGGEYNVSSLVTIATKTFLRYDKLQDLIDSIRLYYPDVTIVIADDNEHPKPIRGHHIEHYIMPFGKGWFAGRNLAVSQVTTKYVLWADDDFIFTADTKLEKMLDVLEKTTLDLVGGAVREVTGFTATFRHTISVEEGGEEGGCIHIRQGHHHAIEGFPNCVVTDGVINFFMARTDKVKEVGFDPRLSRRAHLEFFVDGLGSLHVGSCNDIIVGHASKIKLPWGWSEDEKAYAKFRYALSDDALPWNYFYYFKSRFQCMSSN